MIIDSLGQAAKTNLKSERAEFSVSADKAKKFLHIAVRNLYSNPVLASVVEVSQNAHDEHVRRGIKHKPFVVSIPTYYNPTFSVRDFGAGISPEYMLEGYTQALESTKDNDGDMSGGWGLGRLALLSLASTYNVTTYIKGKERNYSIFESEKGIEILLTHERDTKEENGTLVSAPVPPDKTSQFRDACNRAFRYYEIKPIIKGDSNFKLDEPEFALKGDGWAIEEGGYATSAVCGIYHYPLQASNIPNLTAIQQKLLGNVGLVMFFGASDLAPMANRQGLYYNDKTVAAIKKKLEEIEVSVVKEIQKKFDLCKSLYEAKSLWAEMFEDHALTQINSIFKSSSKITWNGLAVEHNRIENLDKMGGKNKEGNNAINCTYFERSYSRGGSVIRHRHLNTAFAISKYVTIFINDMPGNRGFINRAKSFVREKIKTNNGVEHSAIVLTFEDAATKATFFAKTNLKEENFEKISSVVVVKGTRESSVMERVKAKVFTYNGYACHNRSHYGQAWEISEIDLEEEEEGVYIGLERFAPVDSKYIRLYQIKEAINFLKKEKFIPDDFVLYGFRCNSEEYKNIKTNKDWISFDALIAKFVQSYAIPKEEVQIIADAEEYNSKSYSHYFYNVFEYARLTKATVDGLDNPHLKDYLEKLLFLKQQQEKKAKDKFEEKHKAFISLGGSITRTGVKPTYKIEELCADLKKKLPIMEFVKNIDNATEISKLDRYLKTSLSSK